MEILQRKETYVMCPYNSAHHIRKYRMELHLIRCRRNYPDAGMVVCDFNATHHVPEPELSFHHEHCPDKKFAELTVYQENDNPSSSRTISKPVNFANFPMEEWDDDEVEHSYDPESYCVKNEILRKLDARSAAERRNFRIMERNRFNQLKMNKQIKLQEEEKLTSQEMDELICEMMDKLNTGPIQALIPKFPIDDDLPDDVTQDELKLKTKKNN